MRILFAFDLKSHELAAFSAVEAPTLLVSAEPGRLFFGPLARPGSAPCFACLRHWIATVFFDERLPASIPGRAESIAAGALILELAAQFDGDGTLPAIESVFLTINLSTGQRATHAIFPLRNCPSCAPVVQGREYALPIHCSALTGVVRSMQITSADTAGAVRASADWVSPLPVPGKRPLLGIQHSYGRGRTREEAINGCIGEALERYSLIYRGDEPLLCARLREINAVDPRSILLYSDRQYAGREEWNRAQDERYFVGERFDPDSAIDWLPATDLATHEPAFAPAACCLMWYQFPEGASAYASADTVGCGSARTFTGAVLHALYEWIERDAMAIWWYNRVRRPAVRLESFGDSGLLAARESLRRIGRDLFLLDITTDLQIPAYVSVAPRFDGSEPLFAGAAHASPKLAAWKAASEVGQLWSSPVMQRAIDGEVLTWIRHATLASQSYLLPTADIDAPCEPEHAGEEEQLARVVALLTRRGLQAYAIDLSRPDVTLKTARAIVPGLRHVWHRLGAGRLYSVPVELGWCDLPLAEEDLNSICCMI